MNFGLIGQSLEHSFSKTYFEEKFNKENKQHYQYHNFDIPDVASVSELIKEYHLSGLNITKPHKESVISLLHDVEAIAKEIGAINCIKINWNNNQPFLVGHNTDYYGFAQSIKPFLEPIHQRALILGTGGASKAVAYALKSIGVEVYYVTSSQKIHPNSFLYQELNEYVLNSFKLIVNTTPLGMYPHTDAFPNIPYQYLTTEHLLYDLIYNPSETKFLEQGRAKGAVVINGLNMLKLQADKAWEIWTR